MSAVAEAKRNPFDASESHRLASLRNAVEEMNSRTVVPPKGMSRCCQTIRLWSVDRASRAITGQPASSLAFAIGPQAIYYVSQRPTSETHQVIELLSETNKPIARFLIKITGSKPGIRGIYSVETAILSPIPCDPKGVIFNKGYFDK